MVHYYIYLHPTHCFPSCKANVQIEYLQLIFYNTKLFDITLENLSLQEHVCLELHTQARKIELYTYVLKPKQELFSNYPLEFSKYSSRKWQGKKYFFEMLYTQQYIDIFISYYKKKKEIDSGIYRNLELREKKNDQPAFPHMKI